MLVEREQKWVLHNMIQTHWDDRLGTRAERVAGVAIVERAGPEVLQMLRGQMMGQNQARFSSAIDEITTHTCRSMAPSQLQLI
jgi:hypothetical protein